MADDYLTQEEAEELLGLPKRFVEEATVSLVPGEKSSHDLIARNSRETFLLDLWRGTIRLRRSRYQTRTRTTIILARLDIDSAPHTNPDGERLDGTHLHLYREEFGTRWAIPLDPAQFTDPDNLSTTLFEFCDLCSIERPTVQEPLS